MACSNAQRRHPPDLESGFLREKEGTRFFIRLWPEPVFLQETTSGGWVEAGACNADISLTALKETRDALVKRLRLDYPDAVDQACKDAASLSQSADVPHCVRYISQLTQRIRQREAFLQVIPASIRNAILKFPAQHFTLLRCISQCPEIMELLETNPLLGYMVATHEPWPSIPVTAAQLGAVLRLPRRQLLARLGFETPSNAMLRVIGKVPHRACTPAIVPLLRTSLRNPETVRRLGFLPRINLGVAEIAACPSTLSMVGNGFLTYVGNTRAEDRQALTKRHIKTFTMLRDRYGNSSERQVFKKPSEFHAACSKYVYFLLPEEIQACDLPFPDPPLPDTPEIRALRTPTDVKEEGDHQNNCVIGLLTVLAAGDAFLYRVLRPERATLLIKKRHGRWQIDEISAAGNVPVTAETKALVEDWLRLQDAARGRARIFRQNRVRP